MVVDGCDGIAGAKPGHNKMGALAFQSNRIHTGHCSCGVETMNISVFREAVRPFAPCLVSIVIKALNEEAHIAATIESALLAIETLDGEVILADSLSTDRTVDLAKCYPIRIVQLTHAHERRCGAGPQLGYQHARGEFVYILDGDMQMRPGFLEEALAFLMGQDDVAGVGGHIVEQNTVSLEYVARSERSSAHRLPGLVDRLDGGGLYRRSAIENIGYLSDRNLHSYEEFDLAIRLRSMNWKLWRLPIDAADHFGHDSPPYRLLMRRWRTRYVCGLGELVLAAAGQSRLHMVWRGARELRLYSVVLVWWVLLISVAFWPLTASARMAFFCALGAAPVLIMIWRKRSVAKAVYSVTSWCFNSAGLVRGLLSTPRPVRDAISSRVLQDSAGVSILTVTQSDTA